jgi:hypothetical protein
MTSKPSMTVTYTKILGAPAIHRWPGGLVATTMPWTGGLPHDLGHWMMDAQVDLPWGFWSLAARKAPFRSFTLVQGRWPKDRDAWLERVKRKHGLAMLHAEAHDGHWLADPDLDVHTNWTAIRRSLAKAYAFENNPLVDFTPADVERLRPLALATAAAWEALPNGGCLLVRWPGDEVPAAVDPLVYGPSTLPAPHRIAITVATPEGDVALRPKATGARATVRHPRKTTRQPAKHRRR